MPLQFNLKAFDGVVMGTSDVYTSPEFNSQLGAADRFMLQVVGNQATATSPTVTVQLEHSGDQRNWAAKNGTAEINAAALSASATVSLIGSDVGTTPPLSFVRLRIRLGGTGTVGARLTIHVCGRTK